MSAARRFEFVPFGEKARAGALACDGLVEGDTLHLSHWGGNHTPAEYKADTSVEIALNYAARAGDAREHALVVNNHFDTDGVLAVWSLVEPELARANAGLIVAAAEAGDFEEWPADERGLRLDMAVRRLGTSAGGDERAYRHLLPQLGELVTKLESCEALWQREWSALQSARARAERGDELGVERVGRIAVLIHAPGASEVPGPVLSRVAPSGCTRWLLAFAQGDGRYTYRYERRRWMWADTVVRAMDKAPSRNALVQDLPGEWALKGDLGMTGLARSVGAVALAPTQVAERLLSRDAGAR